MRHSTPPAKRLRVLSQLSTGSRTFIFVLLAGAATLSACGSSDNSIGDVFGMSKNVPDERQVRTHQVLAMPPDLQLRPPQATATQTGQPNEAAQEAAAAVASHETLSQPSADHTAEAASATETPTAAPSAPAAPTQLANADAGANANAAGETRDVYERLGISKTHPDGTPKTDRELIEELKEKRVELEKAKNPNYGTIWNIGNLF